MAAKFRVELGLLAGALLWGAMPARAQDSSAAPPANSADTVGPKELQDFNLQGTVTRPAEPQPAPAPRQSPPASTKPAPTKTAPAPSPGTATSAKVKPAAQNTPPPVAEEPPAAVQPQAARPSLQMKLPPLSDSPAGSTAVPAPAPTLQGAEPQSRPPLSWMLAALAVLGGAGAYWWFNRRRLATAGDADIDEFVAAPPIPAPAPPSPSPPEPAPAAPFDPGSIGVVSTRLRPWVEVELKPVGCVVTDDQVAVEVELTLFNSGNLPARAILLEAAIVNAGPRQDDDLDYFFTNPIGTGKRAASLPPLKKAVVRSTVMCQRKDAQEYEIDGRKVYVPLLAVNALYTWPSGEGQTAGAYVLGKETGSDRLAPFRLDRGPAAYANIAARQLPNGTRV